MANVNMSLKVPEDVHQKFKIYSVLVGKSMSEIITDYIETIDIEMPVLKGTKKKPKRKPLKAEQKKPTKTEIRKDQNPDADEELIKVEILKYKESGLSLQKTADALNDAGVPTLRGGAEWVKGTVDGLMRKWAKQDAESAHRRR